MIYRDEKWHKKLLKLHAYRRKSFKNTNPELSLNNNKVSVNSVFANYSLTEKKKLLNSLYLKDKKLALLQKQIQYEESEKLIRGKYLQKVNKEILETNIQKAILGNDSKLSTLYNEKFFIPQEKSNLFISEFVSFLEYFMKRRQFSDKENIKNIIVILQNLFQIQSIDMDFDEIIKRHNHQRDLIKNLTKLKFNSSDVKRVLQNIFIKCDLDIKVKRKRKHLFAVLPQKKRIYIPREVNLSGRRLVEVVSHEIFGHMLRSISGEKTINQDGNSLKLLSSGTADYLLTEEGITTYIEQNIFGQSSKNDIFRLFNFYLRVIAVELAKKLAPIQVYKILVQIAEIKNELFDYTYFNSEKIALKLIKRLYADFPQPEAGLLNPKMSVYLNGNRVVWEYIEKGGSLDNLFLGKVSIDEIKEFSSQGYIKDKNYLNQFLPIDNLQKIIVESL